jgi:hypothetical protein
MTIEQEKLQDFFLASMKDPDLVKKILRKAELDNFKDSFGAEKASIFKCPACSQYGMTPGSLWSVKDKLHTFVCRKCNLTWEINCVTQTNEEVMWEMKKLMDGKLGQGKE